MQRTTTTLQSRIEEKAGQCRGLAMAMRSHADALGLFRGFDRETIEGWASSLDRIADGITEAAAHGDLSRLRRLLGYAGLSCLIVLGPVLEGGSSAMGQFLLESRLKDDKVVDCAEAVMDGLPELSRMTEDDDRQTENSTEAVGSLPSSDLPDENRRDPASTTSLGPARFGGTYWEPDEDSEP